MWIWKVPQLHSKGLFELHSRGTPDLCPKGTCILQYRDLFDLYCRGKTELYSRSIGSLIFLIHIVCCTLLLYCFPVSQGSHILVQYIADNKVLLTIFKEGAADDFPWI